MKRVPDQIGMNGHFRENAGNRRFELDVDGQIVFATYERRGTDLVIRYVEAPPSLRGTGAAGELMRAIAELARAEGLTIVPLCGYAAAWVRQHKAFRDLLHRG